MYPPAVCTDSPRSALPSKGRSPEGSKLSFATDQGGLKVEIVHIPV
jgi:hypothetical protein